MAPTRPLSVSAIRKQVNTAKRARATASAGSAFHKLEKDNEAARYGFKRTYTDLEGDEQEVPSEPSRKRVTKPKPKKITKPTADRAAKQKAPVIENWRPAGGESPKIRRKKNEEPKITDTLGLARISTWRLEDFRIAAEALVEQHSEFQQVTTSEIVHGGESVTDVFFKFRSELVAEMVKEKIDGGIVEGRKLQVNFA